MKIIVLMPVKNEDWILDITLDAASKIADHILIADQNSNDNTKNIIKKYQKVDVIENNRQQHSNEVRWDLLENSRKNYGINNVILNIDADEIVPPFYFNKIKDKLKDIPPGKIWISSPWIQIWRSINTFRNDNSVWSPVTNKKPFAFIDDGIISYEKKYVINDHTSRVPGPQNTKILETNMPLLHLQFVNWQRTQEKQAWYRCKELLNGSEVNLINQKYSITKEETNIQLDIVPNKWYLDTNINSSIENLTHHSWYIDEIKEMFKIYGKEKFKHLDIWHVESIKGLK